MANIAAEESIVELQLATRLPLQLVHLLVSDLKGMRSFKAVASAMTMREADVRGWCNECGIHSMETLVIWVQLLVGAELIHARLGSVATIAELSGFPSAQAFCNAARRYADTTPYSFRRKSECDALRDRFNRALVRGAV